jgi:hypothetical protein
MPAKKNAKNFTMSARLIFFVRGFVRDPETGNHTLILKIPLSSVAPTSMANRAAEDSGFVHLNFRSFGS